MKTGAYGEYLQTQGLSGQDIAERVRMVQAFEEGLREFGSDLASAGKPELERYAGRMIEQGTNTLRHFDILTDYALWRGLRAQYIALVEITDCYNGMETLRKAIEKRHGADVCGRIFCVEPPALGAGEGERFAYTKSIADRMAELLPPGDVRAAWFQVKHGIPEANWQKQDAAEREKYKDCESVEAFLRLKKQERNEMLTRLHDEDTLWFTMELTDEVLEFLLNDPHMVLGSHQGRKGIVITKVPYQAGRYLRETDGRLKRYYACHCPLMREAILSGEPIPPEVCSCSLGHASHFLTGLGYNLTGEVLESVAQGDDRCRFIFYLPDESAGA